MNDSKATFLRLVTESLFGVTLTVIVALQGNRWLSLANLAFLFLVPVISVASKRGLAGGLICACLATMAFNFFLVPPANTFHVADIDDLVTLFVLALAAILVSQFAARLRAQAQKAEALAWNSERLSALTQRLADCHNEEAATEAITNSIEDWTGAKLQLVDPLADDGLSPLDAAAARWALAHTVEAGRGTDVMGGADALYLPVERGHQYQIAQIWKGGATAPVAADQRDLVVQALSRFGAAIHRVTVKAREQHEVMREAVLASIGHDLRTPLTGIIASLAALPADADGIVESSRAEAARLEALVSNILDLARLRSQSLPEALEAIDLTDAVDAVLTALSSRVAMHQLRVILPADLPLVRCDARMFHHMLLNLIDNAVKFSPSAGTITVEARVDDGVALMITDQGRGLAQLGNGLPKRTVNEHIPGSGLGLSVVSGFAQALGVKLMAANRSDGQQGAQMTLIFPPSLCISATAP